MWPKAEWAFDSVHIRARGIIVNKSKPPAGYPPPPPHLAPESKVLRFITGHILYTRLSHQTETCRFHSRYSADSEIKTKQQYDGAHRSNNELDQWLDPEVALNL